MGEELEKVREAEKSGGGRKEGRDGESTGGTEGRARRWKDEAGRE